jgi:hypothetical protein
VIHHYLLKTTAADCHLLSSPSSSNITLTGNTSQLADLNITSKSLAHNPLKGSESCGMV